MLWIFIVIGALALSVLIYFFIRPIVWYMVYADDYGQCPSCNKKLKMRERQKTVRVTNDKNYGLEKQIQVEELYCPRCKIIVDDDHLGRIETAREELRYQLKH